MHAHLLGVSSSLGHFWTLGLGELWLISTCQNILSHLDLSSSPPRLVGMTVGLGEDVWSDGICLPEV